jgi:hypothetical protein
VSNDGQPRLHFPRPEVLPPSCNSPRHISSVQGIIVRSRATLTGISDELPPHRLALRIGWNLPSAKFPMAVTSSVPESHRHPSLLHSGLEGVVPDRRRAFVTKL